MLERRSALASAHLYESPTLRIEESPNFSLVQVAGDERMLATILGELPNAVGQAIVRENRTLFRIGPRQFWVIGAENDDVARKLNGACVITPLSSSRTRMLVEGAPARAVLMKGIAIDVHPDVFKPGTFAMTGLHHMPVVVHCVRDNAFHTYAMRTFAMSVWEWLTDAGLEFT